MKGKKGKARVYFFYIALKKKKNEERPDVFIDVSLQRGDRRVSPTRKRCCEASTSSSFPNLTVSFITERRLMSGSYTAAKVAYVRACANDTTWKDVLLKESQPIFTPATKKKKKNDILLSQFQRTHTNRTWSVKATAAELTVKYSFLFFLLFCWKQTLS